MSEHSYYPVHSGDERQGALLTTGLVQHWSIFTYVLILSRQNKSSAFALVVRVHDLLE